MSEPVAIVGLGPSGREAPEDWERWGLPWGRDFTQDKWFEIHKCFNDPDYEQLVYKDFADNYLGAFNGPVYMREEHKKIPNSEKYPLDAVTSIVGRYLESSVSYMLAYAILLNVKTVGLYGVNGDDKYAHQRPNLEYLIGFGRGRGMDIFVHEDSTLLRSEFKQGLYGLGD